MGLRDAVRRRMELYGITTRQLAERVAGSIPRGTVEGFLAGRPIKCRHVERLLVTLDLRPNGSRREGQPLRSIVKEALARRRMTTYGLAKSLEHSVPRRTLYSFLAGGEMRSDALDAVLNVLAIHVPGKTLTGGRRTHPTATDAQLEFCVEFWTKKLGENAKLLAAELDDFRRALRASICDRQCKAVTVHGSVGSTLRRALKAAGIPEGAVSFVHAEAVLNTDGSVSVWENGTWSTVTPGDDTLKRTA